MASKTKPTWQEIRSQPQEKKQPARPAVEQFWPHLCSSWGISKGQIIFCRQGKGHNGLHYGFYDPNTRYGWHG